MTAFNPTIAASPELAARLRLPNIETSTDRSVSEHRWILHYRDTQLTLSGKLDSDAFDLFFAFTSASLNYRIQHGGRKNEAIAKAIGLKGNSAPSVIDATAGMGRESFLLVSLGCKVVSIERQPIIHALLENAIDRLNTSTVDVAHLQWTLVRSDSIDYLSNLSATELPDVIYMDPMFPERQKSAAVKKEMRIFKKLAGNDLDDHQLLNVARQKARKRIVVKRPAKAPFVGELKPDFQITSKKHRFDVYNGIDV